MKITKDIYLQRKAELSCKTFKREELCFTCFRPKLHCFCEHIHPFDPQIKFVILIHPMEAKKERLGTGRMTKAFLKNAELIMGVDFTSNERVNELITTKECFILYPGEEAQNLSLMSAEDCLQFSLKEMVVFVIDGTWPCAKKMMKLSTNLHALPRISFNVEKESMFLIKEQPQKYCLSTIESIHYFLTLCEKRKMIMLNGAHDKMLLAFKVLVDFQLKCASDPTIPSYRKSSKGHSLPSERIKSKKWEKRNLLYVSK